MGVSYEGSIILTVKNSSTTRNNVT